MSPARSATSAHRVPSHACPSPRAAGAPFHIGYGRPGRSALPPPQGIAGLYTSFQPPGGLAPSVNRHHCAAVPSAPPHDRRVRNASPGQTHLVVMAGNSPVYSHGCKHPLPVAEWVAGKPGYRTPGRNPYFRIFQPGVEQDDAVRLRQGLGERARGQESRPAGGAPGPRRLCHGQHPGRGGQRGQGRPRRPAAVCSTARATYGRCWIGPFPSPPWESAMEDSPGMANATCMILLLC